MITKGTEITVYIAHAVGPLKGIVENIDLIKGIELTVSKKHMFIPISNILFIEWRETTSQRKLDEYIKK